MKKKIAMTLIVVMAVAVVAFGTTLAYLMASSHPVINVFTYGQIELSLTETTGAAYPMTPGTAIKKDPRLTVKENSEDCWLFFRMEKSGDFDRYMLCEAAPGWTPLPGEEGVYYRKLGTSSVPLAFPLLAGDTVAVRNTVTEQDLAAITDQPTLTFFGYAVQAFNVETVDKAWQLIQQKGG